MGPAPFPVRSHNGRAKVCSEEELPPGFGWIETVVRHRVALPEGSPRSSGPRWATRAEGPGGQLSGPSHSHTSTLPEHRLPKGLPAVRQKPAYSPNQELSIAFIPLNLYIYAHFLN